MRNQWPTYGLPGGLHGLAWAAMDYHGPLGQHGLPWTAIGSHGLAWAAMGLHGPAWAAMGWEGLPRAGSVAGADGNGRV